MKRLDEGFAAVAAFGDVSPRAALAYAHLSPLAMAAHAATEPALPVNENADFAGIYEEWFDSVSRWLRALGAPDADNEDLAQEVFMVVRRRLHAFDGGNLAGWLYRIASRQVVAHRRRSWFKTVFSRQQTVPLEELPDAQSGPATLLETKEKQRVLHRLIARMSEKRRSTFILFEIEGYSGEEIARIQQIPVSTVWTRLHHARKDFFVLLEDYRRGEGTL